MKIKDFIRRTNHQSAHSGCDNTMNYIVANTYLMGGAGNYSRAPRPVINLKSNTFIDEGKGTKDNPYIILTS